MTVRLPIASALVLITGACHADLTGGGPSACREVLSGAVTASFACPAPTAAWVVASNRGSLSIATTVSPVLTVYIPFTGEPQVRSYTLSDIGGAIGGVTLDQQWLAGQNFLPTGAGGTLGSYTLTLTSVSRATETGTSRTYIVHGVLDATLEQTYTGGGVGGTVTLHATF